MNKQNNTFGGTGAVTKRQCMCGRKQVRAPTSTRPWPWQASRCAQSLSLLSPLFLGSSPPGLGALHNLGSSLFPAGPPAVPGRTVRVTTLYLIEG